MIVPTALIIPPAILALIIYMWMYYNLDPAKRLTDLRMVLAIACLGVMIGHMTVIVMSWDQTVTSIVFFAAAVALLIVAVRMRLRDSPSAMRERQ